MDERYPMTCQNPPGFDLNFELLQRFENHLDPQHPENARCHATSWDMEKSAQFSN